MYKSTPTGKFESFTDQTVYYPDCRYNNKFDHYRTGLLVNSQLNLTQPVTKLYKTTEQLASTKPIVIVLFRNFEWLIYLLNLLRPSFYHGNQKRRKKMWQLPIITGSIYVPPFLDSDTELFCYSKPYSLFFKSLGNLFSSCKISLISPILLLFFAI